MAIRTVEMPSLLHEVPLLLLRERPALVGELLERALGVALPDHDDVRIEDPGFAHVTPSEHRADLVVTLVREQPVMGLIVEVQLRRDPAKHRVWPLYVASLHSRLGVPTGLVVVTPNPAVARWARRPVANFQGGSFRPWVLGPEEIPVLDDPARVASNPELGVLSALAHRRGPKGQAVAYAVLAATKDLDPARARVYDDLVLQALGRAARRALEADMDLRNYEIKSKIIRHWSDVGRREGREKGREEGRKEGREEGREEGRGEGREQGQQLEGAQAVLAVLSARGLAVAEAERTRIETCRDLATLRHWLRRAATARAAREIFA